MNNKTLSIVSYLTIIGWLIAFFVGKDKADDFLKYHLKQGLGLLMVSVAFNIILTILVKVIPALGILGYVGILFLILLILGAINAANGVKKPLPIIGKVFENKFDFIN